MCRNAVTMRATRSRPPGAGTWLGSIRSSNAAGAIITAAALAVAIAGCDTRPALGARVHIVARPVPCSRRPSGFPGSSVWPPGTARRGSPPATPCCVSTRALRERETGGGLSPQGGAQSRPTPPLTSRPGTRPAGTPTAPPRRRYPRSQEVVAPKHADPGHEIACRFGLSLLMPGHHVEAPRSASHCGPALAAGGSCLQLRPPAGRPRAGSALLTASAAGDVRPAVDVLQVLAHRALGPAEPVRDLRVGATPGDTARHTQVLSFAGRPPVPGGRVRYELACPAGRQASRASAVPG